MPVQWLLQDSDDIVFLLRTISSLHFLGSFFTSGLLVFNACSCILFYPLSGRQPSKARKEETPVPFSPKLKTSSRIAKLICSLLQAF